MIYVCSLARLPAIVEASGARHIITVMGNIEKVVRPLSVPEANHLRVSMDDVAMPMDGFNAPCEAHVETILAFARQWDRAAPLVIHCWAGISRSTASAFAAACALNAQRSEMDIAQSLRAASPTASPNPLIVAHADRLLGRDGRMIKAIAAIGPGLDVIEGEPFALNLA